MKQNENIACLVVDCCRYVDRSISLEVLNLLSALLMFTVLEGEKKCFRGEKPKDLHGFPDRCKLSIYFFFYRASQ